MNFFKIVLLIGTLMGLLDFKSCPSSVEKAGVTETQVIDFINNVSNEGGNPLESVAKLGELSSIAEKLKTIDETNKEQVLNEVDDEIDKLATTSPTVEAQKEELKAAARQYASAIVDSIPLIGTPAYEAAKVSLLNAMEGWVTSVLNNLKLLNVVEKKVFDRNILIKPNSTDEKFTNAHKSYRDALNIYVQSIAPYRAAEVKFESAIKAVEQAAAADESSSKLEKKELEEERAMLEKIDRYKEKRLAIGAAFTQKWKSLEQANASKSADEKTKSRKKITDENNSNHSNELYAMFDECKKLEECKKILPIISSQYDDPTKSTEYIATQAIGMTMILLKKKRKLKLVEGDMYSHLYDTNGELNISKNPAYQARKQSILFPRGLAAWNLKKLKAELKDKETSNSSEQTDKTRLDALKTAIKKVEALISALEGKIETAKEFKDRENALDETDAAIDAIIDTEKEISAALEIQSKK